MTEKPVLFTVGHSNRSLNEYLDLLDRHKVEAVADVRSSPYSRHMPHFNRDPLQVALERHGIRYAFLGNELGARRAEPECYVGGVARYELIAKTTAFASGLQRIRKGSSKFRLAMMCAEKDPLECHRTILVARALKGEYDIQHLISKDSVVTHTELEQRLLLRWGMAHPALFQDHSEMLDEAYRKQSDEIAYAIPSGDPLSEARVATND